MRVAPEKSYIICCTPRCGSHFLADALASTGICGFPQERFPRFTKENAPRDAVQRDELLTQAPPESSYDEVLDARYLEELIISGTSPNGVFGINIHWFQMADALRRINSYLGMSLASSHEAFSIAFPKLTYIWLRRRDKVAQAVSWYKAVQSGQYFLLKGGVLNDSTLEFDYEKIRTLWSALRSFDNAWGHYFVENRITPITVFYEDLCSDVGAIVSPLVNGLGMDGNAISIRDSKYLKSANYRSEEWIAKFVALNPAAARSRR